MTPAKRLTALVVIVDMAIVGLCAGQVIVNVDPVQRAVYAISGAIFIVLAIVRYWALAS